MTVSAKRLAKLASVVNNTETVLFEVRDGIIVTMATIEISNYEESQSIDFTVFIANHDSKQYHLIESGQTLDAQTEALIMVDCILEVGDKIIVESTSANTAFVFNGAPVSLSA